MKKGISILLVMLMCMCLFTACKEEETIETSGEETSVEEPVSYTFAYSCITMDNPYFIALESSIRNAVEEEGHTLITKDAETNAQLQEEQIKELIEQGIDAIFLAPVDWVEIGTAVDMLNEAGVKIINIDTQVQEFDKVDAYVGSDNGNAGYLCGADLLTRRPEGGEIIIVECPNRNSINERIKGFEKAIAKMGFEVAARIDAQGDLAIALPEVEEALRNNPDVVAIMCGNDPTALGAVVAANAVGKTDVIIYGIDGSPEVKKEIAKENSLIVGTVAQSTENIGKEAVEVALKMLNDEDYEKNTYIDIFMINKENIAIYKLDTWQ